MCIQLYAHIQNRCSKFLYTFYIFYDKMKSVYMEVTLESMQVEILGGNGNGSL